MKIILIILLLLFLWSYFNYYKERSYFKKFLRYMCSVPLQKPEAILTMATVLIKLYRYRDAFTLLEDNSRRINYMYTDVYNTHKAFCEQPMFSKHPGGKNINPLFGWWHHFLLTRFGRRHIIWLHPEYHDEVEVRILSHQL